MAIPLLLPHVLRVWHLILFLAIALPLSPTAAFWNRGFSCKRVERYDTKERLQNDPQAVSVLDIAVNHTL
jgi:hypothetical protein